MKKRKNYSFKTLFTIPVDLKSTQLSLERVNLTKKNLFELKNISFQLKKKTVKNLGLKLWIQLGVDQLQREWSLLRPHVMLLLLLLLLLIFFFLRTSGVAFELVPLLAETYWGGEESVRGTISRLFSPPISHLCPVYFILEIPAGASTGNRGLKGRPIRKKAKYIKNLRAR